MWWRLELASKDNTMNASTAYHIFIFILFVVRHLHIFKTYLYQILQRDLDHKFDWKWVAITYRLLKLIEESLSSVEAIFKSEENQLKVILSNMCQLNFIMRQTHTTIKAYISSYKLNWRKVHVKVCFKTSITYCSELNQNFNCEE